LLNGSLKLDVPLGPLPFNLTLGPHQNLFQPGRNVPGIINVGENLDGLLNSSWNGYNFNSSTFSPNPGWCPIPFSIFALPWWLKSISN